MARKREVGGEVGEEEGQKRVTISVPDGRKSPFFVKDYWFEMTVIPHTLDIPAKSALGNILVKRSFKYGSHKRALYSIYKHMYLYLYLSICISIYLTTCILTSIYLSISLYTTTYLSVSIYLSVYLYIYLSICKHITLEFVFVFLNERVLAI